MTYSSNGSGKGWVGELFVKVKVHKLAPRNFNGRASVPALFWSANDGNFTLLPDGTLQVEYPSNGILEYWKRKDVKGRQLLQKALSEERREEERRKRHCLKPSRPIMLLFRKVDWFGITWHWALGIGNTPSIYEVNGAMAITGPKGTITGIPSTSNEAAISGTKMNQFKGYIRLQGRTTKKTDEEIENFCITWCKRHPVYKPLGPNCQTFVEDLHIFLCGKNLEFHQVGNLKRGPEASPNVTWINK
eukprot:g8119.t1